MRLADYVMQRVAEAGVGHVFMVPGGGAMHLVDALGRRDGHRIRLHAPRAGGRDRGRGLRARHEQPGRGPRDDRARRDQCPDGGGRGMAGVDAVPDHLRTGEASGSQGFAGRPAARPAGARHRLDRHADHQVRGHGDGSPRRSPTRSTRRSTWPRREGRVPSGSTSRSTSRALRSNRPSSRRYDAATRGPTPSDDDALSEQIDKTIELLNAAERPVLLVGNGVRLAGAGEALLRLSTCSISRSSRRGWAPTCSGRLTRATSASPARSRLEVPTTRSRTPICSSRSGHGSTSPSRGSIARSSREPPRESWSTSTRRRSRSSAPQVDRPDLRATRWRSSLACPRPVRDDCHDRPQDWLRRCTDWKERYPVVLPEYWDAGGLRQYLRLLERARRRTRER